MKALSIRQPWAWAILHAGKDIENRDWTPRNPGLRFRGPFLIHAAQGMTHDEYEDCLDTFHAISITSPFPSGLTLPAFNELPRGGIVGSATVTDIVEASDSPWFFGTVGLVLSGVRALPFAPLKGQLGFFDVPDSFWKAAPNPTETRLRALAAQLGQGSPEDVETLWLDMWRAGSSKELIAAYPAATKAIIGFARMKAKGDLTGGQEGYLEMCGKAIAAALGQK